jgi:hypothetical protein
MQQMNRNPNMPTYDPYSPRMDFASWVAALQQNLSGAKDRKKSEQTEAEDREWKKLLTAAQIRNLDEERPVPQPKVQQPTSKVSPLMVKNMMKKLDYPDEVISEVDTMNEPALAAAWAKTQQDFAARQQAGLRVPKTAATQKGKTQQAQLKAALDVVKSRKARYSAALGQLYANPEKAIQAGGQVQQYESIVDEIERQEGEIASMMNNIDETGELTEQQFAQLNTILKFKMSYRPYSPKPKPKTEAESKLPPGFTIK